GAFFYDGRNYSARSAEEIGRIAGKTTRDGLDRYHVKAHGKALLTAAFPSLEECRSQLSSMVKSDPETVLDAIRKSGLRGRGGAGFPAWFKMDACRQADSPTKFVVCNADEGDPGSFSDRYLLEQNPYAVLIGMLIAGYAIGASAGVVYVRYEYPESIERIEKA
ncbi:MAG: formate dehydrogenase, partial [Saprospiraceae bacterium]|nr:formate dehydrogenase [Saprospiraceae bacterium]